MLKTILRGAVGATMFAVSAIASAQHTHIEALEIKGVIFETTGYSARCPSQFGGTIQGYSTSASSWLGKVVFIGTDCITPNGQLFTFSGGKLIITTVSGDQIHATYSGQFVPTGVGARYEFSNGIINISGGTGKYVHAAGGGFITGGEDMTTGLGDIKVSARLAY